LSNPATTTTFRRLSLLALSIIQIQEAFEDKALAALAITAADSTTQPTRSGP
jgi:hypothetical protein